MKKVGASQIIYFPCDLTDETSLNQIELPDNFPKPGIIINNAGSFLLKPLEETSTDEFRKEIEVNLFSAIHTTDRFLADLKTLDRGLIINICSVGALQGLKDSGAYAASKHALLGYTRSLREEMKETSIGVTAINLGQTQSTSWEGSEVDRNLLIDPKDVAKLILSFTELSSRTLVEEVLVQPQHGRVPPM
ncbi:MAG: SDR family oxidoreductase [Balneolaceae bacterium]|nr:SDR family oxidoreductase [Balneolaceae bacterium]